MSQQTIESIFGAKPISLIDLFEDKADLGFRIPTYQRRYDWDGENIHRLFEDVLLGLSYRVTDENALTFLGTIILLEDKEKEEKFNGVSYMIVDGQQRLTTFALISCVLHEALEEQELKINELGVKPQVKTWLITESEHIRIQLYSLFCGELSGRARKKFPFPRIVREGADYRGKTIHEHEYRSIIAKLLNDFRLYVDKKGETTRGADFDFNSAIDSIKGNTFINSVLEIKDCINTISEVGDKKVQALTVSFPDISNLNRAGYKSLFEFLPNEDSERQKLLSDTQKELKSLEPIVRTLLFSSFLLNKVIVTRIVVTNPKYGFDIFDSLNTTGEPLTAIQTFKPIVIRYEASKKIRDSQSELYFKGIENYLNLFEDKKNDRRQKAAKELVVSFSLYKTGEKESESLDSQRRYLQQRFKKINSSSKGGNISKQSFVKDLFHVADYRRCFWIPTNIGEQLPNYPEQDRNIVRLCLRLLYDLKMKLTIPILCRFYRQSIDKDDKKVFIEAVKALTAFVIFRRSVTLNTAGIDSDFRKLMSQGTYEKMLESKMLCVGLSSNNELPTIDEFKKYLVSFLGQKKIGITDKKSWLNKVVNQPLYDVSSHLCRIIHMAAAHNSRIDNEEKWKLHKVRKSPQTVYLSYSRWMSDEVSSAEHIAPKSLPSDTKGWDNWDVDIYIPNTSLKHTLGNLTLLSRSENSLLGDKKWEHKKFYFKAFGAKTEYELDRLLNEEKPSGLNISSKAKEIVFNEGKHRPLAESISSVKKWDAKHIRKRSENIASLAWDEIAPWLFD